MVNDLLVLPLHVRRTSPLPVALSFRAGGGITSGEGYTHRAGRTTASDPLNSGEEKNMAGKRGYSSTTMIGRKDLRHTHVWEKWWFSEKKNLMVRMCHVCGDHEEKEKDFQYP
jgi:hypothetical protein